MKRSTSFVLALVFVLGAAIALAGDSWTGYISDEHCGIKHYGGKGAECAAKCVKGGAKAVFVTDGKILALDKQDLATPHVGHNVKITGTLDAEKKAIAVEKIEMVETK